MGAQSDFISECFAPGHQYRAEQMNRARILMSIGVAPERVAEMLSMPVEVLTAVRRDAKDSE
jgi:hypothetical protein